MVKVGNENPYGASNIIYGNIHFELVNIHYGVSKSQNNFNHNIKNNLFHKKNVSVKNCLLKQLFINLMFILLKRRTFMIPFIKWF